MGSTKSKKRPHRVTTRRTRAMLGEESMTVVNLSLGGACLGVEKPLPVGNEVELLLRHPHLDAPTEVRGEVMWSDPDKDDGTAGIKFIEVDKTTLRKCMLAEFGSTISVKQGVVGYAVSPTTGLWQFYDSAVKKVADLSYTGDQLTLKRPGMAPALVLTASQAARLAFYLDPVPEIEPPLFLVEPSRPSAEPKPDAGVSLQASRVSTGGWTVGFVALTGPGSWSFYSPNQAPAGFMTRKEDGTFKIVLLGENDDGSLDLKQAGSYPEAIMTVYGLDSMPQLSSSIIRPKT